MKKTLKKTFIFTLVLTLLFSALSVQSFALLNFDKIEKIEVKDYEKFSRKEIEDYIIWLEEDYDPDEEDYQYMLDCKADITISSGEVISTNEYGYGNSTNGKRYVDVYSYVDARECMQAFKNGDDKVTLYVEVLLESSIGVELDRKTVEYEVTFVECFVKSLTLVSGEIKVYELEDDIIMSDLDGLCFDIVYGDGTKKRATVEGENAIVLFRSYTLDGERMYAYMEYDEAEELVAEIEFYDCVITLPVEAQSFPVESVNIDSVTFDEKFNQQVLTYTIKRTDGTTVTKTYEFGEPLTQISLGDMTASIYDYAAYDGFTVTVYVATSEGEKYPPRMYKDVIVMVEDVVYDMETFEGPEEEGTVLGEIIFRIKAFIRRLLSLFFI